MTARIAALISFLTSPRRTPVLSIRFTAAGALVSMAYVYTCFPCCGQDFGAAGSWGPFDVGHQRWDAVSAGRDIWIDIWYPVDAGTATGRLTSYAIVAGNPFAFPSQHASAGDSPSAAGPFPLIAFSHGHLSFSAQSSDMAEQLASHGFVFAAPNHTGGATADVFEPDIDVAILTEQRRVDLQGTIDLLLSANSDVQSPFFGVIDEERIGISGHSFGARTAARDVARNDARIDGLFFVSADSIEPHRLPTVASFFVGGTNDSHTRALSRRFPIHTTGPQFMAILDGADHVSYIDVVDRLALLNAVPSAPAEAISFYNALDTIFNTSGEGAIDNRLGTAITNAYAVAFFQSILAGNAEFDEFLTPEYALDHQIPVQFESVGFPSVAELPGDYNDDGVVNAADYTVWRDGGPANYTPADYDIWKLTFGTVVGAGAAHDTAVPEPTSLLLVCGLILVNRRCRMQARSNHAA